MMFLGLYLEPDHKKNERVVVNNYDSCDCYKLYYLDDSRENMFMLKHRHYDQRWILNYVFNKPVRDQGSINSYCLVDIEEEFKEILIDKLGWFFSEEVAVET